MHRISNGTQASNLPVPALVTGTPGFATAGNPAVGLARTIIDPDCYNTQQEELCAVIEAAGITLDKTNAKQLLAALNAMYSRQDGFASDLSPFGYQRLPGGLVFNWFNALIPGDNVRRPYDLPMAFARLPLGVVVSYEASLPPASGNVGADFYSKSQVGIANTSGNTANAVYCFAFGA